jgi:hypothetical protein
MQLYATTVLCNGAAPVTACRVTCLPYHRLLTAAAAALLVSTALMQWRPLVLADSSRVGCTRYSEAVGVFLLVGGHCSHPSTPASPWRCKQLLRRKMPLLLSVSMHRTCHGSCC